MSIKALQDYTYISKYARYNNKEGRRETWGEAVDRVKQMHLRKYPQVKEEIEWAFEQVKQKRVLGSQRALQYGGTPIEKKNARLYNCTTSYCDRLRFFQECFWVLLCGCGVGFSVQNHHVDKLPKFSNKPKLGKKIYQIPDSIEGWSDSLGVLLATYFTSEEFKEWENYEVKFDYSLIRPEGSPLSSGAGKAPGHKALERSLEIIRSILDDRRIKFKKLRPIDAYDIIMHVSDAVLSGGIRRSATIAIFSADDLEMRNAKVGNWFIDNPQRARSNNSVLLLRDQTTKKQFQEIMESVKEFGEPGFYFSDSTEQLPNPCVEIGMFPSHWKTGKSGFQFCNLCEINGKKIKNKEDFILAAKAAAIIGTIQAGYTNFDYLGKTTEEIVEKEALLGVSITGMMDNPDVIFDEKIQKEMAKLVLKINEEVAKKIGINPSARSTCIKPAGTTSCVLGSSSGIHPHHAKRYFRRVQANSLEAPLQFFKKINPLAVEKSEWSANNTDEIITFCIEVDGKTKNDLSAIELLEFVKSTQQNWVNYGKRDELCVQSYLTHNVSNTINVRPDEWKDITDFIYNNRKYFAGISLIPQSGDLDYTQAPMTTIFEPKEIVKTYGDASIFASGIIVEGLNLFNNNLWKACEFLLSPNEDETKKQWLNKCNQFSKRYFEGNTKQMTYCLKCVHNWKIWCDLKREYKDVDFSLMKEDTDETKPQREIACAGGKCEI